MLTKLKSFFFPKNQAQKQNLPPDFDHQVRKAINLIENLDEPGEDEEIIDYLISNDIGKAEANEILLFLPVAFARQLLLTVKWVETYIRYAEKRPIRKKYKDTETFQIIWQITKEYFEGNPIRETVLKIAGRSAEFKAINKLLLDNPTAKFEDIIFTESIIR
ncbi:hypothetical protein [Emticicia fontis]